MTKDNSNIFIQFCYLWLVSIYDLNTNVNFRWHNFLWFYSWWTKIKSYFKVIW
jgi:hypothetical protein